MSIADQVNLSAHLSKLNLNNDEPQNDKSTKKIDPHAGFTDKDEQLDDAIVVGYKQGQGNFIDKLEIFLQDFINDSTKDTQFIGNLKVMQRKIVHKICDRYFIERQHIKKQQNDLGDITIVKLPNSRIPKVSCKDAFQIYLNTPQPVVEQQPQFQNFQPAQNQPNMFMPQFQQFAPMDQMFNQQFQPQPFYPIGFQPFQQQQYNPYQRMPPQFGQPQFFQPPFQQRQNFQGNQQQFQNYVQNQQYQGQPKQHKNYQNKQGQQKNQNYDKNSQRKQQQQNQKNMDVFKEENFPSLGETQNVKKK